MRQIREVLRLHHELALSGRQIGQSLGLHHSTVTDLVARAQRAQVPWPLPPTWDDTRLEQALYPGNQGRPRRRPEPDWPSIYADLRRHKGMTLEPILRT
jgi:transposase